MADGGPPAPQPPLVIPLGVPPVPPVQMPASPRQQIQTALMPHLNWSHFKPKFTGKTDEDVEAHLLRTNDWVDKHAFPESVKAQHFCLKLITDARMWYGSLRPINVDWNGLQNQFRHQYPKIGNTREQVFHV